MTTTLDDEPHIVVAGMGPVGMTAALGLARRGLAVTVLEAGDSLSRESRASTFHPPTLEILNDLGVVDELIATGLRAPGFQYRGHDRELIAHLDMSMLKDDTAFPFRIQNEQGVLTRIILRELERMPHVTLRFGAPIDRVEMGKDCTYVYLPGDGRNPSYRADWLIGADGSGSAVRRSLGIAFEGVTYPERFLVVSTSHDFLEDFENLSYVNYVYDPINWGVLLRTPRHWRVLFPIDENEPDEDAQRPARIEERLQRIVHLDSPYPVVHSTIYRVHQRLAAKFGLGRVLLTGDAAHINNPLGGMGMNGGIHDAHAAIESIAFAVAGGDPDRAVDTYARVRFDAAAVDVQQNTQKNYEEMKQTNDEERARRKIEMAEIAADPERAREYLRGTSMLASFEASSRRLRRSFDPVRAAASAPPGRILSDALGERTLLGTLDGGRDSAVIYVPGSRASWDCDDMADFVAHSPQPVIVRLEQLTRAEQAMNIAERSRLAAVEFSDQGADTNVVITALRSAHARRREVLLIASTHESDLKEIIARGRAYADAGADMFGVFNIFDPHTLHTIHHAVPHAPLVLTVTVDDAIPGVRQLTLAGVAILLSLVPALV